jgi:hypothetical protein
MGQNEITVGKFQTSIDTIQLKIKLIIHDMDFNKHAAQKSNHNNFLNKIIIGSKKSITPTSQNYLSYPTNSISHEAHLEKHQMQNLIIHNKK